MTKAVSSWMVVLILMLLAACGCGGGTPSAENLIKSENPDNIHRLVNLYSSFADRNRGVGPKDESQFRKFISEMEPERLGRMGIRPDALDALFTSERDSQPFEIKYGQKRPDGRSRGQGDASAVPEVAVVLEAAGVNGVRQVGFLGTRVVKKLDSAEAAKIQ